MKFFKKNKTLLYEGDFLETNNRVVNFGIMCDAVTIEPWEYKCIMNLIKRNNIQLRAILLTENVEKQGLSRTFFTKFKKKKTQHVTIIDHFPEAQLLLLAGDNLFLDAMKLEKFELDFVLYLGTKQVDERLLEIPQYGFWAFQYNHSATINDDSSLFWKINLRDQFIPISLVKVSSNHHDHLVLKNGTFGVMKDSYRANQVNYRSSIAEWPSLVYKSLLINGMNALQHEQLGMDIMSYSTPTKLETIHFKFSLLLQKGKKLIDKLFLYEYWNVGIINKPIVELLNDKHPKIEWLNDKKDVFYADPFGYEDEDGVHLIMEELDHKVVKGFITETSIQQTTPSEAVYYHGAITSDSHLSYPFILQYKGTTYCIPENSESNNVILYQLNPTSKSWVKAKVLLENFPGVDSTVIYYQNKWWLFCTKAGSTPQSANNELHIFYSDDLFGEWMPHMLNPVKVDIRAARPAGTPFTCDGVLYRPAQDCSETYGGKVTFNQVINLTPTQFQEKIVSELEPDPASSFPHGLHTVSSLGDLTLIDGKRKEYRFDHFIKKLYRFKPSKQHNKKSLAIAPQVFSNYWTNRRNPMKRVK